jgi:acyl-CoA reductase-like NAD-dependent aldehyde dehydrogenase
VSPTVVVGVDPSSPFSRNELFGPAVAVGTAEDWESAIEQANGTDYGLSAGIFTIHINWTPLWRAGLMPYGGLKASGIGQEGVRSALSEMTEEKTVVLHGKPWQ